MANPIAAVRDFLVDEQGAGRLPDGTKRQTTAPAACAAPVIQYAWDGTPTDAPNREDAAIRITVWTPKGQPTQAAELAHSLRLRLLEYSSPTVWRVDRGAGRIPGVDAKSELPFCSFTVRVVLHVDA